jgi:hypothetical protein
MRQNDRARVTVLIMLAFLMMPLPAESQEVLQDVVLIIHEKETLAFSSAGNQWVLITLRAQERVAESKTGSQVAVVVTNQRALGFSTVRNQWSEMRFDVGEEMVALEAEGLVASVNTSLRALGFGARQGRWVEFRYPYR